MKDVYERNHPIGNRIRPRGLPNNKLTHDLPGYIVTISAGYLVGNPVQYAPPEQGASLFQPITDALKAANADSVDAELAVDAAVYGRCVEICYADAEVRLRMAQLSSLDAFEVYDDTVEHRPIFGVNIMELLDRQLKRKGERVTVYTETEAIHYERISNKKHR